MAVLWVGALAADHLGRDSPASGQAAGVGRSGDLEGKETRFGIWASALFAVSTTGTSTGAVNAMHDSMTPGGRRRRAAQHAARRGLARRGRLRPLRHADHRHRSPLFVAGLMVGRTPELLGKKIGAREMTFVALYVLTTPALVLLGARRSRSPCPAPPDAMNNAGPARLLRGLLRLRLGGQQQRQRLRRDHRHLDVLPVHPRPPPCCSAGCAGIALVLRPRRVAGPEPDRCRVTAGTLPTPPRSSSPCSSAWSCSSAGLTFFPGLALGPIAEALS